jgi:hypothetical protein
MWKKAVVAYFKVLCRHLFEGTEGNENFCQYNRSPGWDLNPGPPEYEAGMLTSRPGRSVAGKSQIHTHTHTNKKKKHITNTEKASSSLS